MPDDQPPVHFLFDLDDTLYPASIGFFRLVSARIREYMMRTLDVDERVAAIVQRRYWQRYGTSLAGLMARHGVAPEPFLDYVHQVPVEEHLRPDPALAAVLASLPGARHVFTNGPRAYARRVLAALGIADLFEECFDIACFGYVPKPQSAPYEIVSRALGRDALVVLVDDAARNLAPARERGWRTVWLRQDGAGSGLAGPAPEADVVLDRLADIPSHLPDLLRAR